MIVINRSYTIKYSKGGIAQFADFNYSENKLVSNSFRPNWVKTNEIPSLEDLEKIEDILKVIKDWSYANQAEIILIDNNVPNYKSKQITQKYADEFKLFFLNFCTNFFKSEILPILKKNKWKISYSWMGQPILIKKVKKEWNNVDSYHKDSKLIDCICNRFLKKVLKSDTELNFKAEHGYISGNSFKEFFYWLDESQLLVLKVFIKQEALNK